MTPAWQDELAQAFERVPPLEGLRPQDFDVTVLPGYTNRNFRLQRESQDWVLRIPKTDTNTYIDRVAEAHNHARAAELGLAPAVEWRDVDGTSLTPTLPARSLQPGDLVESGLRRKAARALHRLHASRVEFRGHVDLGELIPRYYRLTPTDVQRELAARMEQAESWIDWLDTRDLPVVASHNDAILDNLLLEGERLWLIDWEFSSMASPYWDLATLCNAAALTPPQAADLLNDYCAEGAQMEESVLSVYRDLLQLLSDCWMAALVPEAP